MRFVWWMPHPLDVGIHTRITAARISKAIDDYNRGISTYLIIQMPFRHGKSDLVSRATPAYFLGKHPSADLILTGYGADLIHGFSRDAKRIIESRPYHGVFPNLRPSQLGKNTEAKWQVDLHQEDGTWSPASGIVTATGLGGGLTGSGFAYGSVDDYCKEREEAESEVYRNKCWDAFTNSFLTRAGPTCIVIVTATRWHEDDLVGRIDVKMGEDPLFPRFETLTFPARGGGIASGLPIEYPTQFLFESRFSPRWYLGQYAQLGNYASAGLMDCRPTARSGNIFNPENIQIIPEAEFPRCRYVRFWDLASTEKERAGQNPDFTAGGLVGLTYDDHDVPSVWLRHVSAGQWGATKRDAMIRMRSTIDGPGVPVIMEANGAYKDAVEYVKKGLKESGVEGLEGKAIVKGITVQSDKVVRASTLEPVFEARNIYFARGEWNALAIRQLREFPTGSHDDIVDALSGGYNYLCGKMKKGVVKDPLAGVGIF